jgi:hypothetical protein
VGDRVYPIHPPPRSSVVCLTDPLAPLAPPVLAAPPSLDLVPPVAPPTPNRSSSSTSLSAAPLLLLPPLSSLAQPSSHKTRAHSLCWMGWRSERTVGVPGCRTKSIDPAVYRSLTTRLWWMGASTATVVEVWPGSVRSVKAVVMALSEAPVVLGVGPLDQW